MTDPVSMPPRRRARPDRAALAEHGGEVLGDLRRTAAAPLIDSWAETSVEYNRCSWEIEAVGAYAASLEEEDG